jgi:hypothetical protein
LVISYYDWLDVRFDQFQNSSCLLVRQEHHHPHWIPLLTHIWMAPTLSSEAVRVGFTAVFPVTSAPSLIVILPCGGINSGASLPVVFAPENLLPRASMAQIR